MNDAQLANQTAIDGRFNQLQQKAQDLAFGDGTSNNPGYFATRGQQTMAGYQNVVQQLQSMRVSLAQGLSPQAQEQFEFASRRFVDSQLSSYGQHLQQQRRVYADQTANSVADTDRQMAIGYRDDPVKFGSAITDGRNTLAQNSINNGDDPQTTNAKVADWTSKTYSGVAIAKAEVDPNDAWNFYQQHQSLIGGVDQVQVERQLKPALYQWNSRIDADHIMDGSAGQVAQGVAAAAATQGVDPGLALTTAKIESGMGARLQAPGSSASGVFGMMPSTWAANGGTASNRNDVSTQINLGVKNLASSQSTANAAVGGTAAPWQTYLVHQQGAAGGTALLKADPNMPAVAALAPAYGGNTDLATRAIAGNGGTANMTVGQFRDLWAANYARAASTVSVPAPGTAPGTPTSTNPRDHAADWLAQADGVTSPLGTQDPLYADMVASRVRAKIGEIEYAQAQSDRAAQNTLLSASLGMIASQPPPPPAIAPVPGAPVTAAVNSPQMPPSMPPPSAAPGVPAAVVSVAGGTPSARPTSIDQLLAISPDVRAAWTNASPETQRGVLSMLERNATEGPPVTPQAQTAYYRLLSESTRDPDSFLKENLAAPDLLNTLPRGMVSALMTRQASIDGKQVEQQDRVATMTHARAVVQPDLMAAGIKPPSRASTPTEAQAYADFDGRLDEALQSFQQQNSRRPNDSEIKTIGQTLLTPGFQSGTGHLWGLIGPKSERLYQAQTSGSVGSFAPQVPANDRTQIIAAYGAAHGGARPTDEEIGQYYMTARSRLPAQAPGRARPSINPLPPASAASSRPTLPMAAEDDDEADFSR